MVCPGYSKEISVIIGVIINATFAGILDACTAFFSVIDEWAGGGGEKRDINHILSMFYRKVTLKTRKSRNIYIYIYILIVFSL